MNKNQLQLIESPTIWRLDDETKEIGREGLALARSILRSARTGEPLTPATTLATDLTADQTVEVQTDRKAA